MLYMYYYDILRLYIINHVSNYRIDLNGLTRCLGAQVR